MFLLICVWSIMLDSLSYSFTSNLFQLINEIHTLFIYNIAINKTDQWHWTVMQDLGSLLYKDDKKIPLFLIPVSDPHNSWFPSSLLPVCWPWPKVPSLPFFQFSNIYAGSQFPPLIPSFPLSTPSLVLTYIIIVSTHLEPQFN